LIAVFRLHKHIERGEARLTGAATFSVFLRLVAAASPLNRQGAQGAGDKAVRIADLAPRNREPQFGKTSEKPLQGDGRFDAGELGAQANVNASAEGQVAIGLPVEVELLRVRIWPNP
jgi:hypothetical protein